MAIPVDRDHPAVTRVYLHTFGCKANQYDSEVVRQALEDAGAAMVDDPALADAAVVNSCTVTHVGEAKMRGLVRRLARRRPGVRTIIMGCAASVDDGSLARLPGVVAVRGGADPNAVLGALGMPPAAVPAPLRRFARGTRAWLKIQDGCDEHCTFCATVIARGRNRSRPPVEVVSEARLLAEHAEEIVLTGVHIGGYGRDLEGPVERRGGRAVASGARRRAGQSASLSTLVERLINDVARVRFRLSSIEATEVDERLEELMVAYPDRLAPHLHAPLQSGSDRLLRRMGRHWYTSADYRARIERLVARLPVLALGADIIVGFPGENDADHAATRAVLSDLPFTYVHVFPYSERPDAAARRLGTGVASQVQHARAAELRALVEMKTRAHEARRLGREADIVVLDRRAGWFEGLTEDYLTVRLPTSSTPPSRFRGHLRRGDGFLIARPEAA